MRPVVALATWLTLAVSSALAAPPAPVRAVVSALSADCRAAGGKPGASPGLISAVDVDGDGRDDHVIYTGAFECEGAESLFGGTGGGSVQVFLSTAQGGAKPVFEHGAVGLRAQQRNLWLAVGGALCGQKVTEDTPRSAMQACWRPLQWDARRRMLEFGPLSSVQRYP
ncbi:MAG TPA: hypothetical protein VGF12_07655 [Roseateles sp.]|uniref:hypothetical protein n=1 Tax=Roseateles sp. TaxID=1971397 RepID=UPI002ED98976